MKYKELINTSKYYLDQNKSEMINIISASLFSSGAKWMTDNLNKLDNDRKVIFNNTKNFNLYGILKYFISLSAFVISAVLLYRINIFLVPLSVIIFYFFEVHFLFLFPLLIDNVSNPILKSIQQTYKIGIINSLFTVMTIGFFMIIGLFNLKFPLRNWYIGCMAILIWYQNEVRNRL